MTVEEYNSCVDAHADGLYRFIVKNMRDEEEARDVVQDTFEKLWLKRDEVQGTKMKSYLFTAGYHTMIDRIRRLKKQTDFTEVDYNSHAHSEQYNDLKDILNEAVNKLPDIQKSVVLLRDYEGYSYEEIGQITGLNESQVKVYIYRARVFLKEYIGSIEKGIGAMKIDKHNYEAYLLDYHEGNLNTDEVNDLFRYAKAYPELNISFDTYVEQLLIADETEFLNKQWLKIADTGVSTANHLLIASLEGDLQTSEKKQLAQLLKTSAKAKQAQILYENTRLTADLNVVYSKKAQLKRKTGIVRWIYPTAIAAAASICLLIGYWFITEKNINPQHIAVVQPPLIRIENKPIIPIKTDIAKKENIVLAVHSISKRKTHIPKALPVLEREQIMPLANRDLQPIPVGIETPSRIELAVYKTENRPVNKAVQQDEYPNLTDFAVKYITEKIDSPTITAIVEDKMPHSFWDYATLGINKLAEATGADFKIEWRAKTSFSK